MKQKKRMRRRDKPSAGPPPPGPYICRCGAAGFVDLGAGAANRFPCKRCYLKKPVSTLVKNCFTPSEKMAGLHWPSETEVAMARARKSLGLKKVE